MQMWILMQIFSYLFQHANCIRSKVVELLEQIAEGLTKQKPPTFSVPDKDLPLRADVQPGTWFARDNVYNFIKFCRLVGKYVYYIYQPCAIYFKIK